MYDAILAVGGFAVPIGVHRILLALVIIGTGMWIGGMVAVTMLAIISKRALEPAVRAAFFRRFARTYFPTFGAGLVVAAIAGFFMLIARGWDGIAWAITILVIVILIALAFGVVQARAMSRLRTHAAELGSDTDADLTRRIASGARSAALLRGSLGVLSLAVFVLAIFTAG
ncbi:MAG: hypothetical protein ABI382_03965 [Nakamurella sp.]